MNQNSDLTGLINDDPMLNSLKTFCEKQSQLRNSDCNLIWQPTRLPWENKVHFLDVDGVMTEGGMFYTEEGAEFKRFDTKDGMAIKEAMKHGIEFGIISSGVNKAIIQNRADMFRHQAGLCWEPNQRLTIAETWLADIGLGLGSNRLHRR